MDSLKLLKSIQQLTVTDVWPIHPITWISSTCNLRDTLELLKTTKVLSFPVIDVVNGTCLGAVDIMDIAMFIVASFPSVNNITNEVLVSLEYEGKKFLEETKLAQVFVFSKSNQQPTSSLRLNSPLMDLMAFFSQGCHRVPIMDGKNQIINFISQMDLLRFLTENIYLFEQRGIGKSTVDELNMARKLVHFVRSDVATIIALSSMTSTKVSAVPILDKDTGRLVGNFSISDLRGLGPYDLHHLLLPLVSFLGIYNPKSLYPLTCKPSDTFEYVVLKLSGTKVHRLWVVDNDLRVLGVVSLTDVVRPFLGIESMKTTLEISTNEPSKGTRIPIW